MTVAAEDLEILVQGGEEAEEGEPCEATRGCRREAAFTVTCVFRAGHLCRNGSPSLLCLPHTDEMKAAFDNTGLICLHCNADVLHLDVRPFR